MPSKLLSRLLTKNLSGKELTDEKIQDFKTLLIAQGLIVLSLFLLNFFSWLQFPYYIEASETFFFGALGLYAFQLWDMLRNYTNSPALILTNFIFIMGMFLIGFIAVNPFVPMPVTPAYKFVLILVQVCLLGVECTVIYFTLIEFFKRDLGMPMRLWGAACIYLMIGFAFGSAYEIICILEVQCLGVSVPLRTIAFMMRYEFSLMVLGGMDNPYQVAGMVLSLGTVEALCGQLFVVLIVGRLLMK